MAKIFFATEYVAMFVVYLFVILIGLASGVYIVNELADYMGVAGHWTALLLIPVLFVSGTIVCLFLLSGIRRIGEGMASV